MLAAYTAIAYPFEAIDLEPAQPGVVVALDDTDDGFATIPLGAEGFRFYGKTYTGADQLFVSPNGLIAFGSGDSNFLNTTFGTFTYGSRAEALIAPLWDDWRTDTGAAGAVLYLFDAPNQRLIIEWSQVPHYDASSSDPATFQAILQLNTGSADGRIIFNYVDLLVGDSALDEGKSASVGIRFNTAAPQYLDVDPLLKGTGKAILISHDAEYVGPVADIVDVAPDPRNAPVSQITIVFSEAVAGFGIANLSLRRDSGSNLLTADQTLTSPDNITWTLGNLTSLTGVAGTYTLTLSSSGIVDDRGDPMMSGSVAETFVVDLTAPTADVVDVKPDPRVHPVDQITIKFSEPVSGLDLADLSLRRNGGPNLLSSAQTLTSTDGRNYVLGNLRGITSDAGLYALLVTAAGSGIVDAAGNALAVDASDVWTSTAAPGSIGGIVWADVDGDGVKDPAEQGVAGWTVYLDVNENRRLDAAEPSVTTDADGAYLFESLWMGSYTLCLAPQSGWRMSAPAAACYSVALDNGQALGGRDFGVAIRTEVHGSIWEDVNEDGRRGPGEGGVGGWIVYGDENGNGTLDQQTTSISSSYWQTLVPGGTVTSTLDVDGLWGVIQDVNITLTLAQYYIDDLDVFLVDPQGLVIPLFTDVSWRTWSMPNVVLDDEAPASVENFYRATAGPLRPQSPLSALDMRNPNGRWTLVVTNDDPASSPGTLSPWSLTIAHGEPATTSDSAGDYAFFDLPPGDHTLRQAPQTGWTSIAPAQASWAVHLAPGQVQTGIDFGNHALNGSVNGTWWNDLNGNGVRDPGESGLADQRVFLDTDSDGRWDVDEPSTLTDADGNYEFGDLPAGVYHVAPVIPAGWRQTAPQDTWVKVYKATYWSELLISSVFGPVVSWSSLPLPAPPGSFDGPQALAVGPASIFYLDGSVAPQVLYELDPQTGLVIDADIIPAAEPVGGLGYLNGLVYLSQSRANTLLVWDPRTDSLVGAVNVGADISGGLTGSGELGVVFGSVPGTGSSVMGRNQFVVAIDPTTGAILGKLRPVPEYMQVNWTVPPLESMSWHSSEIFVGYPPWGYYRVDPLSGFTAGNFRPPEGESAVWVTALGGDGAIRSSRVLVRGPQTAVADFGAVRVYLEPTAPGLADVGCGPGGSVMTSLTTGDDRAYGLLIANDGRIIVVGTAKDDFGIVRYNADGTLDTTFGAGGIVTTPVSSGVDRANAVAVQADGKIVVAGLAANDFGVVRYNPDGTLDSSFGTGGKVITPISSGTDAAFGLRIETDGSILVAGAGGTAAALVRYTPNGTLDSSFGTGGIVIGPTASIRAVTFAPSGHVLFTGTSSNDVIVIRYDASGVVDASFGTGGIVRTSIGNLDEARGIGLQADGRILVAGSVSDQDFMLVRYTPTGHLDETFGNGGIVRTHMDDAAESAAAVAELSDGRIVVACVTHGALALRQFQSDGTPDTSFAPRGQRVAHLGLSGSTPTAMAIDAGGRIVVAGYASNGNYSMVAVIRYLPDAPGPAMRLISPTNGSVTADNTPTFSIHPGDWYAGPYFRVYRDGVLISGLFESGGTYTAPPQPEGTHAYTLTAVDTLGNESAPSGPLYVTIDTTPPVGTMADFALDPTGACVDQITLTFSEPVFGLELADLTLSRDGSANLLTASQSLTSHDGIHWVLGNLANLTTASGYYGLSLDAATACVSDLAGNALSTNAWAGFLQINGDQDSPSQDDTLVLSAGAADPAILEAHLNGALSHSAPFAGLRRIIFNSADGDDTLIVQTALPVAPSFKGGPGRNTLIFAAGSHILEDIDDDLALSVIGGAALDLRGSARLASLSIGDGSCITLGADDGAHPGDPVVLFTESLSIVGTGRLDLGAGDLIVGTAALADVQELVRTGHNGGAWNGPGIHSSRILSGCHALGYP